MREVKTRSRDESVSFELVREDDDMRPVPEGWVSRPRGRLVRDYEVVVTVPVRFCASYMNTSRASIHLTTETAHDLAALLSDMSRWLEMEQVWEEEEAWEAWCAEKEAEEAACGDD